jgi:malate/lactate dehydrogenase
MADAFPITNHTYVTIQHGRHAYPTFTITNLHAQPITHTSPYNMADTLNNMAAERNAAFPITNIHGHTSRYNMAVA